MIITLRGTSGSGKSTVAFTLLKNFPNEKITNREGKVMGYKVEAGLAKPVYIVGRYETACGGCDAVPTQKEAADRALYFHSEGGHVIMEGLLMSAAGPKGAVTAMISETEDYTHAFLDTPLELCLERVRARRLARGDERPLNPTNTEQKFSQSVSTFKGLKRDGYKVALIDHTRAFEDVMDLWRAADAAAV